MDTVHIFLTWQDVEEACIKIHKEMEKDGYVPESIVALLRGGVVPARIFSDYFNILLDFFALDVKLYDGINNRREKPDIKEFYGDVKGKEALVVDDIWDSGKTMDAVLVYLDEKNEKATLIKTATLCWKETAKGKPDYCAMTVKENEWIVFPWERQEFFRETGIKRMRIKPHMVLELRKKLGSGLGVTVDALKRYNGNMSLAEEYLNENNKEEQSA
jgi:hypoxanthine phosphoribosyltransferase